MKKLFAICCFLSFLFCDAQTPKTMDSLKVYLNTKPKDTNYVQALNDYAFLKVQEAQFDEVEKAIKQMDALAKKLHYGIAYYKAMNMRGIVEYSNQNHEKAMEYFMKCSDIIKKYKLPKKIYQNWLNNISIIHYQLGDQDKATFYAMKLINYQEKYKLEPLKTSPYDQIGHNLKQLKKYDEALNYYNKGLAIAKKNKNFVDMGISENNLGNLYDDMHKTREAIGHYQTGLGYAEEANYKLHQTDFLSNLGRMYRQLSDYAKAEQYLKKAEKICYELEVTVPLKTIYQALGDVYSDQKRYALSETYYMKSLKIAQESGNFEELYTINTALAELKNETGNYKEAFQYKEAADVAKDSTFKLETAENTENLLRKYESEKKEQAIKTLSAQNTVKNLQIDTANKQRWYFVLGLALLGIIGTLLFYQSRNRKKVNEKLQLLNAELDQANKVKTRFFSILNHDLRSPVSNLIHFLHLQKENPELLDEESKKRLENKTILGAENLLNSMEDILLWSKGQMENFEPKSKKIAVSSLFEDTQKHFSSEEKVSITFQNPQNMELNTDENYLKTIIRNLTGNAIKALDKSEHPTIQWKAWQENNQTFLSITDNGSGGTQEQFKALYDDNEVVGIQTGLGLHLIRDLAKAIDCSISVNSKPNQGTTFVLSFI
jgi:signal transduction histidine kinase